MRQGFFGLFWLVWTLILVLRLGRGFQARRKDADRERRAAQWPTAKGRVRGGSVRLLSPRWRLELTYDAFESGHGIELWHHDFLTRLEAEHAEEALTGRACIVHYNPERGDDTTLVWTEVKELLADDPYVPRLVRLGRNGYRWMTVLAVAANAGLLSSVILYAIAMSGSKICVCDEMMYLLTAAPFVMLASLIPMSRVMVVAPREGMLRRLGFLLSSSGVWAMTIAVLGAAANLAHYGPIFRALPMDADVPSRVFAGAIGVLAIPIYLFASIVSLRCWGVLRPVAVGAEIVTTV